MSLTTRHLLLRPKRAPLRGPLHELQGAKAREGRLAAPKFHPSRLVDVVAMLVSVRCARNACCTRLSERPCKVTAPIARVARPSASGTNWQPGRFSSAMAGMIDTPNPAHTMLRMLLN